MWGRCYDLHSAGDAKEIKTLFNPTQSARGLPRGHRVPLQDGSEVRSLMLGDEQGLIAELPSYDESLTAEAKKAGAQQ